MFHQPGDIIEYTLTIKNASSVGAAIKSILIDNQSVTSDTEITKGNIVYTITMPSSTTLSVNAETTMKVKAKFQDATDIVGKYTGENNTLTISINSEQDDGSGGFTPIITPYTGTIYRWSTTKLANNTSCGDRELDIPYTITNLTKGTDYITEEDYPTASSRVTAVNHNYYLKHGIVNNEIINSYVCLIFNNSEYCFTAENGMVSNIQVLQEYQAFYNLSSMSGWNYPSASNPGCQYNTPVPVCYGGGFHHILMGEQASVFSSASFSCRVLFDMDSYCLDS